ncbi:Electron transfer flavoprotein subunit beta [Candidatus Izimaplasma bacterium HR1]|jgi:electron transfer flavoprotein beta subunit|uniref:electron transfer flavoprotein subunit beta/FixA family protein n=1 Tax=Candidatus Izimoplasma sp. HR1 TaxID=1541959 RepID=UPI0004F5B0FF|nr:Electron transfer flavoprotein subunit beta [Candidatus Izimaplasma bacterium HR1]
MKIVSCIKQVYDLDIVLENDWVVDESCKSVDIHYANRIMNSYDEASLEMMLQLKDKYLNIMTQALTIGNKSTESILKKALAIGVDEVIRIDIDINKINNPNDNATLIYESVKEDESIDIIFCGKQSDINNYGQTGQILAEKLHWSCFTNVFEIEYIDNQFHISRLLKSGIERIITKAPFVITSIPSADKFLRMATLRDMMRANKETIKIKEYESLLTELENRYNFEKITIEKPVKKCIYLEDEIDSKVETQLDELITKYREIGDSK